jgi:Sulfatase
VRDRAHRPKRPSRAREALTSGAHLAVLSSLALAQPIFDILGRNATFFAARGSTSREIVLFAIALVVLPPLVLGLIELGVGFISRPASRLLHLVFVAGLGALLVLSVVTQAELVSGPAALAAGTVGGVALAIGYAQTTFVRSLVGILVPVPLVFLALFLFQSDVRKLLFVDTPEVRAATVQSLTPVVLIIFDEFNTTSLMNGRQNVDAGRYPNFARLARESTWYRNASTTFWLSEGAVPAILTGTPPTAGNLPVLADHPRNLFTFLGGSYQMRVIETLTSLCPRSRCGNTRPEETQEVRGETNALASDVGIVYLHVVLPDPYVEHVPPIDTSWGNFGRSQDEALERVRRDASGAIEPCARGVCEFTKLISNDRRPTLYFLHSLFPHVPYVFLPSSRRYAIDARVIRGMNNGLWLSEWAAKQAQQRYLLQLVHTDRALGHVLDRLRATGVYDRALVIVTADHGVSFKNRDQRRLPTPTNLDDIGLVPLFVKLPHQKRGRTDDSFVQTTAILPTIARVLGVPLRWRVQGQPLVGRRLPRNGEVTVYKQNNVAVHAPLSTVRALRARTLARQVADFGSGNVASLYRIGPRRAFLGRPVSAFAVRPASSARVEIDGASLYDAVDPSSGFLPSFVEGRAFGLGEGQPLAVAVNGRVAATTQTFEFHDELRFAAFVPEQTLRRGKNAVDVFAIRGRALEQLRGTTVRLTLRPTERVILRANGRRVEIRPGALRGTVRVQRLPTGYEFSGSASPPGKPQRVDTLVVFVGDRSVFVGRHDDLRPQSILGQRDLGRAGFTFELPPGLLPEQGAETPVRVFAIQEGIASELRHDAAYPWKRG